jgi:hypothetical protein
MEQPERFNRALAALTRPVSSKSPAQKWPAGPGLPRGRPSTVSRWAPSAAPV